MEFGYVFMNILFKIGFTLLTLGMILAFIGLVISIALHDSRHGFKVALALMNGGSSIAVYSTVLYFFWVSLEGLRGTFGRSFITKLTASIVAFGLGLLLVSPLSLLLLISLQMNTVQKIGISILSVSAVSLLVAFFLDMIHRFGKIWRD